MGTIRIIPSPEQAAFVSGPAHPYLWRPSVGDAPHGFFREVTQIMNLGRYEDILRREAAVDGATRAAMMREAQSGWFDARSWEFWRGRLSYRIGAGLSEAPPQRRSADAEPS